eukprot:4202-Heterococcus_DN1.PRE.1
MTAGVAATRAAAAAGESHSNSAITYDLASSPPSSPRPRPPAYHDDPWPDMDLSTAYAGRTPPYSPPGSYALSPPRRADYASLAYTGSPRPYGDGAPYGRMFSERYRGLDDYAPPPMLRGGYSALADSADRYRGSSSDSSSSSSTASRDEQQPPRRTRWGPA